MPSENRSGSQRFQRDRTISLVMNALRENGAASRSELATTSALGLDSVQVDDYWSPIGATVLVDNDANCCAWNLAAETLRNLSAVVLVFDPDCLAVTGDVSSFSGPRGHCS